ncbi:hypothetical protein [Corynebacterium sp. HS2168-gen11]|uniref:hypothetical protein n=1 Tax=Corynebacterium sp. HS2168-gen11 TaxID=2974027 RepID=UPI00216B306C|nr:hypothetical protein [Corynebacterium sp. HS2168-gen11]MCS4536273.1 hypothetical protein [Corynebacterium sp. HS2168-gen11]
MLDPIEECLRLAASGNQADIEEAIEKLEALVDTVDLIQQGRIHIFLCEMHAEFGRWEKVRIHSEQALKLPYVSTSAWCWSEYVKLQTQPDYFIPAAQLLPKLQEVSQEPGLEFSGLQVLTMLENTWQGAKFLKVFLPWVQERLEILFTMVPDSIIATLERNLFLLFGRKRYEAYLKVVQWPQIATHPIALDFYNELVEYCIGDSLRHPHMPQELYMHAQKMADLAFLHDAPDLEVLARKYIVRALLALGKYPEALLQIDRILENFSDRVNPDDHLLAAAGVDTETESDAFITAHRSLQGLFSAEQQELRLLRLEALSHMDPHAATDTGKQLLESLRHTGDIAAYGELLQIVLSGLYLIDDNFELEIDYLTDQLDAYLILTPAQRRALDSRQRLVAALLLAHRAQRRNILGDVEGALADLRETRSFGELSGAVKAMVDAVWTNIQLMRFELDPDHTISEAISYLCKCGQLANDEGDFDSARRYLERSIILAQDSLDPADAWIQVLATLELGMVFESIGEQGMAMTQYETALQLLDDGEFDAIDTTNAAAFAAMQLEKLR